MNRVNQIFLVFLCCSTVCCFLKMFGVTLPVAYSVGGFFAGLFATFLYYYWELDR